MLRQYYQWGLAYTVTIGIPAIVAETVFFGRAWCSDILRIFDEIVCLCGFTIEVCPIETSLCLGH